MREGEESHTVWAGGEGESWGRAGKTEQDRLLLGSGTDPTCTRSKSGITFMYQAPLNAGTARETIVIGHSTAGYENHR